MFMKKFIKVLGIVAILGSLGIASTTLSTSGVSESQIEDITTVDNCDALLRMLGACRSTVTLSQD
jgi:hypothetical protein